MTESPAKADTAPNGGAVADFGIDTTSQSSSEAIRDYFARLRGGELGSLPALLGLLVLVIAFSALSDNFFTLNNTANLVAQGAGKMIIAMGLVFVLLLGEIDLSAGTLSGVCAAVMAMHYVGGGNLLGQMGSTVFYVFIVGLLVAAAVALWLRIWAGAVLSVIAVALSLLGVAPNAWLEMLLAVCVGAAIGCLTGFMVSKVGMPSFVVTLALFITWQGVILQFIGEGGVLGIRSSNVLFNVANGSLSMLGSWVLCIIAAGGYALVVLGEHFSRLRRGLVTQPTPIVLVKVGAVVALSIVLTWLLTLNRSPNPDLVTIRGVPYVIPIILGLLVIGTFVLNRTRYGRHIYATGGNAEAARRAGINVGKIRASVFVVSAAAAAIGAIVYSSKAGSVDPQAGGLNTLLFAVGAAVIGGTSLFGGRGKVAHAVIGGLVLAVVENGLGLLRQPAAIVNIVTGLVLLLAATVDALSRRRAAVSD
ncbi:MAG TPA: ABC transporter permease [Actinophytocola sp.]|jgi:D-xylose transport system permease protein|uniref:sugar ABC transporter permease n=1 Tax=Actinophytocola sp. TaxID=1872138 RepID=UPI002F9411B0